MISYGGPGDGDRWFRSLMGYERYLKWRDMIVEERRKRTVTGENTYVSAFDFLAFSEQERAECGGAPGRVPDHASADHHRDRREVPRVQARAGRGPDLAPPGVLRDGRDERHRPARRERPPLRGGEGAKKLWIIPPSGASFRYATHLKGHGYAEHVAKAFIDWFDQWIPPSRATDDEQRGAAATAAAHG